MWAHGPGRLPRLPGYDYSSPGYYFVTIGSWRRRRIFGSVDQRGMRLSSLGQIVQEEWVRSFQIRPTFQLDVFVVMPDHFHGLVGITAKSTQSMATGGLQRLPRSLSSLIACFKASCTRRIDSLRGTPDAPVWQLRFHDHVVRTEGALLVIRRYIQDNPRKLVERLGLQSQRRCRP